MDPTIISIHNKYKKILVDDYTKLNIDNTIIEFIKKHNMIIYGGMAIDALIRHASGGSEFIYDPSTTIPDYDVYSVKYLKYSKKLAKLLHTKYNYIRLGTGITGHTKKIWVSLAPQSIIDISHINSREYDIINPILIDDISYANPQYIKIDQYQILNTNLFQDYYRINKTIKRVLLLEKYYPITTIREAVYISLPPTPISYNKSSLDGNGDIDYILCGGFAYNKYYKKKSTVDKIIVLSNDIYNSEIPKNGVVGKINFMGDEVQCVCMPLLGPTFYVAIDGLKIATPVLQLYIRYYLRAHNQTNEYDDEIKKILKDPFAFTMYFAEISQSQLPTILIPHKTKIIDKRISYDPTIYLNGSKIKDI